jgi:predicted GIY-YIG superfamily endonuclease
MYYVYILRSKSNKNRFYIGFTNNLERRLNEHENAREAAYTHRYAPWDLETYIVFNNEHLAKEFELYLKSHSGRAFLRRRLIMTE